MIYYKFEKKIKIRPGKFSNGAKSPALTRACMKEIVEFVMKYIKASPE